MFSKRRRRNRFSNLFGGGLLLLSSLSLVSIGFSTWHIGNNPEAVGNFSLTADDVKKDYSLSDLGITCGNAYVYCETLKYTSKSSDGSIEEANYVISNRIGFSLNIPLVRQDDYKSIKTIDYSSYFVKFSIGCSKVTTIGSNENITQVSSNGLFSNFLIYPINFPKDSYSAKVDSSSSGSFYFPLKTRDEMSIYQLANIDQSISSTTIENSTSSLICSFEFDKDKLIDLGIFNDNVKFRYSITIGLSDY